MLEAKQAAYDAGESLRIEYRMQASDGRLMWFEDRLDDKSSNVYTSPQIEAMFGYPAEQWIADTSLLVRLLHPTIETGRSQRMPPRTRPACRCVSTTA